MFSHTTPNHPKVYLSYREAGTPKLGFLNYNRGNIYEMKGWVYVLVFVVLVVGAAALLDYYTGYSEPTGAAVAVTTTETTTTTVVETGMLLRIINDFDCDECDISDIVEYIEGFFPDLEIKEIDYNSDMGEELISRYGITEVPALLIDSEIEDEENFELVKNGLRKVDDVYVVNLWEGYYTKEI